MLRLLLVSDLSSLCALVKEGALPVSWLVDEDFLVPFWKLDEQDDFCADLITYGPNIMVSAVLASQCGVMTRQFISHVEEIWQVITELTFVKNHVTELDAYHKMSRSVVMPLSLQQLARKAVHAALLQQRPK
jgi:hypothetical protein